MRGRDGGEIICGTDFSKSICKVIPHKKYSSPNFARIKQRPKNTKTNNFKHLNLNSRVKSGDIYRYLKLSGKLARFQKKFFLLIKCHTLFKVYRKKIDLVGLLLLRQ